MAGDADSPIDFPTGISKNEFMSTVSTISPEMMARLVEAADKASRGVRDLDAMREACERMDRLRERIRQKHGLLDVAVPAIRELRDS